jgi:cytochrome P450
VKRLKDAPGPRGLPIVGSFFEMREDPLAFFEHCAKTYGRFYRLRAFDSFVLVNDPALLHGIFERQSHAIKRSRRAHEIRVALGDGLVVADDDRWRCVRDALVGSFHPQHFLRHREPITKLLDRRAQAWHAKGSINLRSEIARLTLAISSHTFFDMDLEEREDEIAAALEVVNNEFAQVMKSWAPLPLYVPSLGRVRVRRSYHTLADVARRVISRTEQNRSESTAWIIGLQRMCAERGLPDRLVLDQVIFLLMASYDTTAVAITYTMWLLSRHLSLQNDLARKALAYDGRPGAGSLVKPVFEESMRLFPPVWGLGREAAIDLEVGDYLIPAGTQILTLPYIIHRDPDHFDAPDVFRPERFFEKSSVNRSAYLPFGLGPQACMGAQFATVESLMVITHLLMRYEFHDRSAQDLGNTLGITLRPKTDFVVEVRKRAAPAVSGGGHHVAADHGRSAVTASPAASARRSM